MPVRTTRRFFLSSAAAGGAVTLSDWLPACELGPVSAAEAAVDAKAVQLRPDIEPWVKLIEDTPRPRLLEEMAAQVRKGLSYRQVLAALLLAGVRNIQPRPSVGFKFHSVLVVNSAHLASLSGPPADRWLPIFWALDYFKATQAQDESEGNWTMGPVDESTVPPPSHSHQALVDALEHWDESAADAAAAGMARSAEMHQVYELLFHYGCRDFRSIGHKAIYVANSYRTLGVIGWQYCEPVIRSLVYALLNHTGEPNPADSDLAPDRPWRGNKELAGTFRQGWQAGTMDNRATGALLQVLRESSAEDACRHAAEAINSGVHPASIWDAVFTASGEWVLRQPGIVALHAVTTANALNFGYRTVANDLTRRLLLLQAVAFVPLFRQSMSQRGSLAEVRADALNAQARVAPAELDEIFSENHVDRLGAARKTMAYLRAGGSAGDLIQAARRLTFLKGNDPHDYKYSSAALEDYEQISAPWRDGYLAACTGLLNSHSEPDNALVGRIRQALA